MTECGYPTHSYDPFFFLNEIGEINKKNIKFDINNEDYSKQIYPISRIYLNDIL